MRRELGRDAKVLAFTSLVAALACGKPSTPAVQEPQSAQQPATPATTSKQEPPPAEAIEATEKPTGTPAVAPPYTADAIREATRPGRTYVFRLSHIGKAPQTKTVTFVDATDAAATMMTTFKNASGKTTSTHTLVLFWQSLEEQVTFPTDGTKFSETTVTTPAGSFEVYLYTVTKREGGDQVVARYYFAKDLPGLPVKTTFERNGKEDASELLVRYVPGN